jgi:hypothetical protein
MEGSGQLHTSRAECTLLYTMCFIARSEVTHYKAYVGLPRTKRETMPATTNSTVVTIIVLYVTYNCTSLPLSLNSAAIFLHDNLLKSVLELFNVKFHKRVGFNKSDEWYRGLCLLAFPSCKLLGVQCDTDCGRLAFLERYYTDRCRYHVAVVPVCTYFVASVRLLCILMIHVPFISLRASVQSVYHFTHEGNSPQYPSYMRLSGLLDIVEKRKNLVPLPGIAP